MRIILLRTFSNRKERNGIISAHLSNTFRDEYKKDLLRIGIGLLRFEKF